MSVDAVVLGCTHYPFVRETVEKLMPNAHIFDGCEGTARQVKRLLEENGALSKDCDQGIVVFENTLGNDDINALARKLLTF